MNGYYGKNTNQRGMASLMVTTVLVLVIALIIIGFSQVTRRNQREALDRQLSTQAFFAAESGVDKTVAIIRDMASSGQIPPDKTDCTTANTTYPDIQLDGENVRITCVLVNNSLDELVYSSVTEKNPVVVPLVAADPSQFISKVTLTWRSNDGGSTPSNTCTWVGDANYRLPARSSWGCGHGLLRADISELPDASMATAVSAFFYPRRATTPPTFASAPTTDVSARGGLVNGSCSDSGGDPKCMASMNGFSSNTLFMSLRSIYHNSSVTINGFDTLGNEVKFKGQALVDITARAQDVVRRIQVRVPIATTEVPNLPAFAIESTSSLCKRFSVQPSWYKADSVTCD